MLSNRTRTGNPLIIDRDNSLTPLITIVERDVRYLIGNGYAHPQNYTADSIDIIINGFKGKFMITKHESTPSVPRLLRKDGFWITPTYDVLYDASEYTDIRTYQLGGHVSYFYVTFY